MWMRKIIILLACLSLAFVYGQQQENPFSGRLPIDDPDCVAAYFMNSGTSETDRSGNSITLAVTGSPNSIPTSATVPPGYSGTSRDFESADTEWLEAATFTALSGKNAASFCIWFKWESDSGAQVFMAKNESGQEQFRVRLSGGNNPGLDLRLDPGRVDIGSSYGAALAVDGLWHHLAWVYTGKTVIKYIDGKITGSQPPYTGGQDISSSTSDFRIGSDGDGFSNTDGLLDEAIVFRRALTNQEIDYIYRHGISGDKGGSD